MVPGLATRQSLADEIIEFAKDAALKIHIRDMLKLREDGKIANADEASAYSSGKVGKKMEAGKRKSLKLAEQWER